MITKFDIDDSLAAQVESTAKARGMSFREFIREALRQAVRTAAPVGKPIRFVQSVHDFGTHLENPWTLLADLETEEHILDEK